LTDNIPFPDTPDTISSPERFTITYLSRFTGISRSLHIDRSIGGFGLAEWDHTGLMVTDSWCSRHRSGGCSPKPTSGDTEYHPVL